MKPATHGTPGGREPNWPNWFLLVGFVLGITTVLATPAFRGPDEFTHTVRVATIDRGYLVPPKQSSNPPGYRVDGCLNTYAGLAFNRIIVTPSPRWTEQFRDFPCGPPYVPRANGASSLGNTEVNSPILYVPALVGLRVGRALGGATWSFYGARLAQMLAYVVLVWFALRLLPWGRPFLFAVALVPAAMQLSGTISADPVTNGLAFVIIAATLWFIDRTHATGRAVPWRQLGAYGTAIALFALTKPAALPIVAVATAIPTEAFGSFRRRLVAVAGVLVAAAAIAGAWTIGVVSHIRVAIFPGADSIATAQWVREHPFSLVQAVGRAWTDPAEVRNVFSELVTVVTHDPYAPNPAVWVVIALIVMLVISRLGNPVPDWVRRVQSRIPSRRPTLDDPREEPGDDLIIEPRSLRQRRTEIIVAVIICVVGFGVIEYGVAIAANPPGARAVKWVQARYFIPYLPLALFGAHHVVMSSRRRVPLSAIVPTVFLVGLNLWWLTVVLRTFYTW